MERLFENYINTEGIMFKYAKGKSAESGKEFHIYHEIIFFIDGKAEFITENIHIDIKPGTVIVIPKETYHQMTIHGDQEEYCRCVINFYDVPQLLCLIDKSMYSHILMPADKDIEYLFEKLIKNISNKNESELLNAVLVLLLNEIAEKRIGYVTENSQNIFVRNAVKYINNNIGRKITINEIATACMISPSSLSHIFKKEMNISLHKFIVKKRLINAYNKISSGVSATTAAIECGFNDYSGFYKQYKKMFNVKPSQKTTSFK